MLKQLICYCIMYNVLLGLILNKYGMLYYKGILCARVNNQKFYLALQLIPQLYSAKHLIVTYYIMVFIFTWLSFYTLACKIFVL